MASLGERVCRNLSQYHSVLMERATITLEELVTLCNKEMFLTPEESIKMGFVDCIIGETPKTKVTKKGPRK